MVQHEEYVVSFVEVARRYRKNPATVHRWAMRGFRLADDTVVRLRARKIGGRYSTSWQAVEDFLVALNPGETEVQTPRSPGSRARASEQAGRELQKAGI